MVSTNNIGSSVGFAVVCYALGLLFESSNKHAFFASNRIDGPDLLGHSARAWPGSDELFILTNGRNERGRMISTTLDFGKNMDVLKKKLKA